MDQLAKWAKVNEFQGVELWGIHARHLSGDPYYNEKWLNTFGLHTSMISDYLPLHTENQELLTASKSLSALGHIWGTKKLRTFAGNKASSLISLQERKELANKLRIICDVIGKEEQFLLLETHPNTLTDTVPSTLQLLEEVNHPALKVNFDVLHIWESGADPVEAFLKLRPHIMHFHFKNIASRNNLAVFEPENVYAAAGSREGMVPLFKGSVDYIRFLKQVFSVMEIEGSLEWFGRDVTQVLENDSRQVWELWKEMQIKVV
jgi:3-dehydroshikimate dehydratase